MTSCPITGKRQFASKAEAAAEIATCKAKAKSEPRRENRVATDALIARPGT